MRNMNVTYKLESLKVRTAPKSSPQIKRPKPRDYTIKKKFVTCQKLISI